MLILEKGRVLDPSRGLDEEADVVVEGGRIAEVGRGAGDRYPKNEAVRRLDASGRWVVPAFVDLHAHLREPGKEYKEDIASGLAAAARAASRHVCAMPNTRRSTTPRDHRGHGRAGARRRAGPCLHPIGAITMGQKGDDAHRDGRPARRGRGRRERRRRAASPRAPVMRRALEYASHLRSAR
jgi:dihydroorotase